MKPATPLDMLFYRERTTPRKKVLFQPVDRHWKSLTWEEVGQEVRTMATYLKKRNFEKGARIAIFARNSAHWFLADWAIWLAGYVSVPLYPNLTANSINKILSHAEADLVFIGSVVDWQEARQGIPPETELIALPEGGPKNLPSWKDVKRSALPMSSAKIPAIDDMATIIYTSGTTGEPKGVVHTFRSMAFAGSNMVKVAEISPKDRLLSYLPLSHVAERIITEMNVLYSGASVYFNESLETFMADMKVARPTVFLGVPRVWAKIREQIDNKLGEGRAKKLATIPLLGSAFSYYLKSKLGMQATRLAVTGAAPISKDHLEWFEAIGIKLQEAYGMTENMAYSHFTRPNAIKLGSVGTPFPGVECKIAEDGEVLMRGASLMWGYYRNEELTKETINEDGWLRTGDLGVIEEQTGSLKITGRKKDIFKTSKGKYVVPNGIEDRLERSNIFEQVCVMGNGQPQPVAIVRLQESQRGKSPMALRRDISRLRDSINAELDRHEQLDRIAVVNEEWTVENGVLTPTMKIKRNVVESRFERAIQEWSDSNEDVVFVEGSESET